jgi:Na+(H+)/acetate symporter ActP
VVLMASRGVQQVQRVAEAVGLGASRRELVAAYAEALATAAGVTLGAAAALMDRLERGVRLM